MVNKLDNAGIQVATTATPPSYAKGTSSAVSTDQPSSQKPADKSVSAPRQDNAVSSVSSSYVARQSVKEASNETAQAVRQLDEARAVVDQVRQNLSRIVKMYPPYAKDDPARAQFMSSVAGLRQVTEKLTIPPPYSQTVSAAMDLPGVKDINANDAQVAEALSQLDNVSNAMATESRKLFDSADVPAATGVGSELEAQQQSQKVGGELGSSSAGISSEAGRQLVQTLA